MTHVRNMATGRPWQTSRVVPALVAVAALALAGCESNGLLANNPAPETAVAPPPAPPKLKTVAVYPVLAAPAPLNKQLQDGVADAIDKTKYRVITVADGSTPPSDYQLRGYGTASRDKSGAKFAYFFDVLDGKGEKLNRIAGEEPLGKASVKSKDLWQKVTPDIVKSAASKTASSFAAAATGTPAAAVSQGTSAATPPPTTASTAPAQTAVAPTPAAAAPATPSGPLTVAIMPVTGAPGDGDKSLTAALKTELRKKGLIVVEGNAPATYKVQGQVTATPNEAGQEDVKIAWDVKDAGGGRVATVSQGNTVEKGALAGAWGATAGDVAAAASVAILPLLKKTNAASAASAGPG